jgi:hypothetical protein
MAALPPYSFPVEFELIPDESIPVNPYSDPEFFTLDPPDRPGPFSDPVSIRTNLDIWFTATSGGWEPMEFKVFVS